MSTILCLRYNNHYNRILKREVDLAAYLPYAVRSAVTKANFAVRDGITTSHTINGLEEVPDYLVVADDHDNITSRWFVLEADKQFGNQYVLQLRRDLKADFYDNLIAAPVFIEKAPLPATSPLIFNPEQMTFNRIKRSEKLIKDETGCPWIVGYVPRDAFPSDIVISAPVYSTDNVYESYASLQDFPFYNAAQGGLPIYKASEAKNVEVNYAVAPAGGSTYFRFRNRMSSYGQKTGAQITDALSQNLPAPGLFLRTPGPDLYPYAFNFDIFEKYSYSQLTNLAQLFAAGNSVVAAVYPSVATPESFSGKTIRDESNGRLYTVEVTSSQEEVLIDAVGTSAAIIFQGKLPAEITGSITTGELKFSATVTTYYVTLRPFSSTISITLGPQRNHLVDAPYDMFAIPYSDDFMQYKNGGEMYIASKANAISVATAIAAQLGSANIYDIQLLPYCPLRDFIKEDGTFDMGNAPNNPYFNADNYEIGAVYWGTSSRFSFEVQEEIILADQSAKGLKISNETELYRLADPSQSAFYEFSVAKNGGSVEYFEVDCEYKPYTPYIHVVPNFKGLYGRDFNDVRGLICSGDFSLPQLTSAWAEYQMQNKNYQRIFDREIESLDIQQGIERKRDILSAFRTIGAGIAGGVAAATLKSGPVGAAGGVAASGLGIVSGITSPIWNEQLRQDARDLKVDMYGYNLGNIQAIPYALTKVSAFNQNNKLFPFLEVYTATDEEIAALDAKLTYNGFTVMVIGRIGEYLQPGRHFFKGQIIRLEGIADDYHVAAALADELEKGVFIDA